MSEQISERDTLVSNVLQEANELAASLGPMEYEPMWPPEYYMPDVHDYYGRGMYPPNCIGYALARDGVMPAERFIGPEFKSLAPLMEALYEPTDDPTEAHLFAVIGYSRDDNEYSHVAYVEREHPGWASQRAFPGGREHYIPLAQVAQHYRFRPDGTPAKLVYLKPRDAATNQPAYDPND